MADVYVLIEDATLIAGVFDGENALANAKAAVTSPIEGIEWEDKPNASTLYVESQNPKQPDKFWQAVKFETNITYWFDPKHLFNNEGKV